MTQAERDRLVVLKKTRKGLATRKDAALELEVSERQIRRLLGQLKQLGDKSVIHALKGKPSNHKIDDAIRKRAVEALSDERCHDFGPTYARDYLASKKKIEVSKETVRRWMREEQLWRAGRRKPEKKVHLWRERRSRFGELVQWDTSEHDWLEGRGSERLYLIAMIDDATSRLWARFALHDSTEENMNLLASYLKRHGRPAAFYTDQASLFRTAPKVARRETDLPREECEPLPPTQIQRALGELGIVWIAAHSPQAKGRIERSFATAQDRLVKGLRLAGVKRLAEANQYLETEFLPWWDRTLAVEAREPQDAHRPLEQGHDLDAILCPVETRKVKTDYTFQFEGQPYVIERADIGTGLRGADLRIEKRRDKTIAVRFQNRYLRYRSCQRSPKLKPAKTVLEVKSQAKRPAPRSKWMKDFLNKKGPSIGKAIAVSNATS
ncbi:MAG: ISNCY family transposase [Blastocatellia bacterium]